MEETNKQRQSEVVNLTRWKLMIYNSKGELSYQVDPLYPTKEEFKKKAPDVKYNHRIIGYGQGTVEGVPIYKRNFTKTLRLPPIEEGKIYLVARIVAEANPYRDDLVIPLDYVYDEDGVTKKGIKSYMTY